MNLYPSNWDSYCCLYNYGDWYEFVRNAIFFPYFGICLASLLYNHHVYSSLQNLDLINLFAKKVPKRIFWEKNKNK